MNQRMEDLTRLLATFLDRKSVPMNLQGKPNAQAAEVNALIHAVMRFAPRSDWAEWWERMETAIGERSKTRGWPTEGEIKDAALSLIGSAKVSMNFEPWVADTHAIMAERIKAGAIVGEAWVYGRCAVELIDRGMVTEGQLRPYRSALFFTDKDVYGQAEALRLEADRERRHQFAADLWQGPMKPPTASPVKTMTRHEWD